MLKQQNCSISQSSSEENENGIKEYISPHRVALNVTKDMARVLAIPQTPPEVRSLFPSYT